MSDFTDLVDRYIATWNETDPARRRELIKRTWTETASYIDPLMSGDGPAGIDAMIQGVQQRFPGHRFHLAGKVDAHNDRVRFAWSLGTSEEAPLVAGVDFGQVAKDGRLQSITGFLDRMPGA